MPEGLRARLTLVFGGLTLLAVAAFALLVAGTLERLLIDRLGQDLEAQARLLAGEVARDQAADDVGAVARTLARVDGEITARAVAVDATGRMIGASEPDALQAFGDPAEQGGLQRALRGETVREVLARRGPQGEVLYVAVPVQADGRFLGAVRLAYQLGDIEETIGRLNLAIAVGAVGTAVVAGALAAAFAGAITAPVRALSRAARAVARGDFDQRIALRPRDEVGQSVEAFNEMAARLREFELARQQFAGDISHELHALSGAMQAAAEALARGAQEEPPLRDRLVAGLVSHTRRLGRLADDLLELSRLEGGRLALNAEPVSLADVARQTAAEWTAEATLRGVRLDVETTGRPTVRGDRERLVQACGNLVENALKYTDAGGQVTVAAAPGGAVHHLEVRDDGRGIPADELPRIFHRFYRVEGRLGEGAAGMGLGLAIVDRIVRAHGGSITATSILGHGSTFRIRLPSLAAEDASAPLTGNGRP